MFVLSEVSFLHFKAVGVGPERLVGVEVVEHFPGHDDIFTLIILHRYRVQLDVELNDLLKLIRESNFHDSLLISTRDLLTALRIIICHGPLLKKITLLIEHILVKLTVLMRKWIVPFWSEDVGTLF